MLSEATTGWTHQLTRAVMDTYDFSPFKTVVDVGGGYGPLPAAILGATLARGDLVRPAHVISSSEEQLVPTGVADRCTIVAIDANHEPRERLR